MSTATGCHLYFARTVTFPSCADILLSGKRREALRKAVGWLLRLQPMARVGLTGRLDTAHPQPYGAFLGVRAGETFRKIRMRSLRLGAGRQV
jgi:hypothetical protein